MSGEKAIWRGAPSQVTNFGWFLFLGILTPVAVGLPLLVIIWKYLVVKCTKYELTTERLKTAFGVLNKQVDEIELYRVRDYQVKQPFFLRLFSLSNIVLTTSDKTHPIVVIRAVKNGSALREKIRTLVEHRKKAVGVRELDIE